MSAHTELCLPTKSLKIMFFLALSKLPSFVTASKKIAAHFTELSDFCINIIIPLKKILLFMFFVVVAIFNSVNFPFGMLF